MRTAYAAYIHTLDIPLTLLKLLDSLSVRRKLVDPRLLVYGRYFKQPHLKFQ